jgi:hypothetical protein
VRLGEDLGEVGQGAAADQPTGGVEQQLLLLIHSATSRKPEDPVKLYNSSTGVLRESIEGSRSIGGFVSRVSDFVIRDL